MNDEEGAGRSKQADLVGMVRVGVDLRLPAQQVRAGNEARRPVVLGEIVDHPKCVGREEVERTIQM